MAKPKKVRIAGHESQVQTENYEASGEEQVPPTIVEANMEECSEGEKATGVTDEQQAQPEVQTAPAEQPASKKSRGSKRPYLDLLSELLTKGECTRKVLIDKVMAAFPQCNRGGVQTVVSDLRNPRYSVFKERAVIIKGDKLIFADCLPETASQAEVSPAGEDITPEAKQAEQSEQPAE